MKTKKSQWNLFHCDFFCFRVLQANQDVGEDGLLRFLLHS